MLKTIRSRCQLAVASFAGLLAVGALFTFDTATSQAHDGQIINVSGRQRMLIQRSAKAALAAGQGSEAGRAELESATALFTATLTSLISGGEVALGSGVTTTIPATTDGVAMTHLRSVERQWGGYVDELQRLAIGDATNLSAVLEVSNALLHDANAAVKRYEAISRSKITRMKFLQAGLFVLGISLGAFILIQLRNQLLIPLASLAASADAAASGDLSATIRLQKRDDELGRLTQSFSSIWTGLQGVCHACDELQRGNVSAVSSADEGQNLVATTVRPVAQVVADLVEETTRLATSAREGQLEARCDDSRFDGAFKTMIREINDMIDTTVTPINHASSVLAEVAASNLSERVDREYRGGHNRIAMAVNKAIERLDTTLRQVVQSTQEMSTAGSEIAAGANALAQDASQQAASIEEINSSVAEMSSMGSRNASSAEQARAMTRATREAASQGRESMESLSQAMVEIKQSSDETAKIVNTIDEIAFQTNLLALNAAVEAARAGDAGKGFAVVAEEVRNLAMRSADAAKSTSELIEASAERARRGVEYKDMTLSHLQQIVEQVENVGEVIDEIALASTQQSQGVSAIESSIAHLTGLTQRNAATAEESASAAEEMSLQCRSLADLSSSFRFAGGDGFTAVPAAAPHSPVGARSMVESSAPSNAGRPPETHTDPEALIPFDDGDDSDVLESF